MQLKSVAHTNVQIVIIGKMRIAACSGHRKWSVPFGEVDNAAVTVLIYRGGNMNTSVKRSGSLRECEAKRGNLRCRIR